MGLLYIDAKVHTKIMSWVNQARGEVSGLGMVQVRNGDFMVTDAMLFKQKCTGASTELDAGAIAKAMHEYKDHPGSMNFWWHSHVNMGVFWSGTDMDTIAELGGNGWLISTVFNKKEEMLSAYYQKGNEQAGLHECFFNNIETVVKSLPSVSEREGWTAEFKEKVSEAVYTPPPYSRRGWWNGYDDDYYEQQRMIGNRAHGNTKKKAETQTPSGVTKSESEIFQDWEGTLIEYSSLKDQDEIAIIDEMVLQCRVEGMSDDNIETLIEVKYGVKGSTFNETA